MSADTILKPGSNCWKIVEAEKAAFLIDAETYFKAFASAAAQAQKSIFISGWDFDRRIHLIPRKRKDQNSLNLGDFLNEKTATTSQLHVHILCWDYSMIYAVEREWLRGAKLGWKTHRRVHFHVDGKHPAGASHHQKFVVIDGAVAFSGGIDLAKNRWDTSQHKPNDPRRRNPDGTLYKPYHDVQMAVSGKAAATLGSLFKKRWLQSTGQILDYNDNGLGPAPWPKNVRADFHGVDIAIARTFGPYLDRAAVQEVATLYRDALQSARRYIYIENQFFTSQVIAELIEESLRKPEGPEIVLVLPKESNGWFEKSTMDAIRFRILQRLQAADKHRRLRIFYPAAADGGSVFVHAKVMIVDDCLALVGSANLTNRSMSLDSECVLAVEAGRESKVQSGIVDFRNRLLADHLDASGESLSASFGRTDSFISAIEKARHGSRSLRPIQIQPDNLPLDTFKLVPDSRLIDFEKPLGVESLVGYLGLSETVQSSMRGNRYLKPIVFFALPALLAASWRWSPLAHWLQLENLQVWGIWMRESAFTPLLVLSAYLLGGIFIAPVTLLVTVTAVIFSPMATVLYALTGCTASALLNYGIGRLLDRGLVQKIARHRFEQLQKTMLRPGLLTVALVRNLPVASFAVINIVAGASGVNIRDFVFGTLLGMLPGIVVISILTDRFTMLLYRPQWVDIGIILGIGGLAALGVVRVKKHFS